MIQMKTIVLAAGKGTRLGEICEHTPKPLVKLGGEPVLVHNLRWLAGFGITDVKINLHHLGERIEATVGDGSQFGVSVQYSREPELLGTAGTVADLREWIDGETFLVVYGDNRHDFDLQKLLEDHESNLGAGTLAVFSLESHQHTGLAGGKVEMDRSNRILRFIEERSEPSLHLISAGCYVLDPVLLDAIPSNRPVDFGKDVFPRILREQIFCGHVIDGRCLGIDTPDALSSAHAFLREEEGVAG